MKKILILVFGVACWLSSEAQQPFKEYGYKVKVATLSGGKYQEFFDQDTVVQIGTVLLNRRSGKIVSFVKYDTTYGEYSLQPELISRWMSPDPLAEEFYSESPYNFSHNNPINFLDPDGQYPIGINGDEPNSWQSTFIRPDGTIIEHRDDDDYRIYMVTDEDAWDAGGRTTSGLATVGVENPNHTYVAGQRIDLMNKSHNVIAPSPGNADPDYTIEGFVIPLFSWLKYVKLGRGARLFWGFWDDYAKVVYKGKEYAKVGGRYYTRHAVDRMTPSGLGKAAGGEAGRSISPNFIEDVITSGSKTTQIVNGVTRTEHTLGGVSVITEEAGKVVVTIITK